MRMTTVLLLTVTDMTSLLPIISKSKYIISLDIKPPPFERVPAANAALATGARKMRMLGYIIYDTIKFVNLLQT